MLELVLVASESAFPGEDDGQPDFGSIEVEGPRLSADTSEIVAGPSVIVTMPSDCSSRHRMPDSSIFGSDHLSTHCPVLTFVVDHLAVVREQPEHFVGLPVAAVDFAASTSGTVAADWESCSEERPGAALPSALVAEVAVPVEGMLAFGAEDVKSPVAPVVVSALEPGLACYSGSSSSAEPELVAPGLAAVLVG